MASISSLFASSPTALAKASVAHAASLARLSSGNKINRAADDIASLVAGSALSNELTSLRGGLGNASQGSSLLQVADGALTQQLDILNRQKSLALQASSGQLNDSQRSALNQEFQSLTDQLNQLASSTNFNGVSLLDGSTAADGGSLNFTLGGGAEDTVSVVLNGTDANTVFAGATIDINSQSSAAVASAAIDGAITSIGAVQASVGALQSRFNTAGNAITSAIQAQDEARTQLLDTDIAAESTRSAASLVQMQAAIATRAQTNKLAGGLLRLLA